MKNVLITSGGLVLVGAVVIATFLYGNHQHQTELQKKDQAGRVEQTETKPNTEKQQPKAQAQQPKDQKPATSTGSGSGQPTPPPVFPDRTPETGSGTSALIASTTIVGLAYTYRRSRQSLALAIAQR